MRTIPDIWSDVRKRVGAYINPWTDEYEAKTPPKSAFSKDGRLDEKQADDVAQYAEGLFTDAKSFFEMEFKRTKDFRFNTGEANVYWKQNRMLEAGDHWGVFGHRNTGDKEAWKQELVDPLTGYNLRTRVAYLTANWHEIQASPNIADLDPILHQERKATCWTDRVTEIAKYMGIFGEAWTINYLDKGQPYGGLATEYLCRPGSLLLNPGARGKERSEQCWYAVHVDMVSGQWIADTFPKFNISDAHPAEANLLDFAEGKDKLGLSEYNHTKFYDKVEVWMDDPYLEPVPFKQEEFDIRFGKIAETFQGVSQEAVPGMEAEKVTPLPTDNHPRWIKAYLDTLEERASFTKKLSDEGKTTEEDEFLLNELARLVAEQIKAHEEMAAKTPYQGAKVKKYPFGRHIIKIGGRIAMDQPFEYEADWRKFLNKVYNEKVPLRLDGRSDVEIQRPTQLAIDTFISRFGDHMILNAYKKKWFPLSEKANIEKNGFDNDPLSPGYTTTGDPPREGHSAEPTGYITMYDMFRQMAEKNQGINQVAFGNASPGDSGRKVDTLLQQTEMVVTGEGNKNLQAWVEAVIEARLLIMRQFYVQPRPYTIGGKQVLVVVANRLKNIEVLNQETGETETIEYPNFEISVRPDSNAPYKWERELQQLTSLLGTLPEYMQPMFAEMILDLLSERYPELGPNGKLRAVNEDAQLGAQIRERREALEQEKEGVLESIGRKKTAEAVSKYMARNGNGNQPVQA